MHEQNFTLTLTLAFQVASRAQLSKYLWEREMFRPEDAERKAF
jgi:hypothetical protein